MSCCRSNPTRSRLAFAALLLGGLQLALAAEPACHAQAQTQTAQAQTAPVKRNIVLMVSDDLAVTLGCYGHALAKTPHLDTLAAQGRLFERAYCQFPHCNPSRASFLSGKRPDITRVTNNNDNLYTNLPGVITLPHLLRMNGYATARCGKIFHLGVPTGQESMDDPQGWDFGMPFRDERPYPKSRESSVAVSMAKVGALKWNETVGPRGAMVDEQFADTAVDWLQKRDRTKPFLLAVGFHRPHVPLVAPAEFFDLYPFESITLPDAPADDEADIPLPARNGSVPQYTLTATPEQRRAAIRAYLACVSYVDFQVGLVLAELRRQGLDDSTVIIFISDHGWHLGEHGLWHKRSLFEESARVPMIIRAPGMPAPGRRSTSLVELLDLYPTVCEFAGLPVPEGLDGKSLRPILDDPQQTIRDAAFTQARRGAKAENWGRSLKTARYRCTEWDEGKNGIELYDHETDPREYTNLATDPHYATILAELRTRLREHFAPAPSGKKSP